MNARLMLIFSGISGFFCVAFGAIGSHLLSPLLNHDQIEWIRIGLRYQSMHTLVLMILGAILLRKVILWFYWGGNFLQYRYFIVQWQFLLYGTFTSKIFCPFGTSRRFLLFNWLDINCYWCNSA